MPIPTDLVVLAQGGDKAALAELCERLRPLITSIARKAWSHPGFFPPDLIQVGFVAFLEVLPRFDPSRGASLARFAYPHIRGAILRSLAGEYAYSRAKPPPRFTHRRDNKPLPHDGISASDQAGLPVRDFLFLEKALGLLDSRQREVVALRFGLRGPALSVGDIAATLHLTKRYARQILDAALSRLRAALAEENE